MAAFSSDETGVPVWIANQLLTKVETNLRLCPGEPALAKESAALLISLVDKQEKAAKLVHTSGLASLIRYYNLFYLFSRLNLALVLFLWTSQYNCETHFLCQVCRKIIS
jgi:hypothetical protein